jgi:K+-transporting ATPase A subunit
MTLLGIAQILIFFGLVLAVTKPAGVFMYNVFEGKRTFLHPVFRPLERVIYRLGGVNEDVEQTWVGYTLSLLAFSFFCFLFPYVIQRLQGILPFNPMHFSTGAAPGSATALTPDLAFNTAVSFMTNTNWQSYSPDTTLGYFVQMAALGGCDALHHLYPASHFDSRRAVLCMAGIHSEFPAAGDGANAGRRIADHRAGSTGIAARDQDARNKWRRVL